MITEYTCEPLVGVYIRPESIGSLWVLEDRYLYYTDYKLGAVVCVTLTTGVSRVLATGTQPRGLYIHAGN